MDLQCSNNVQCVVICFQKYLRGVSEDMRISGVASLSTVLHAFCCMIGLGGTLWSDSTLKNGGA